MFKSTNTNIKYWKDRKIDWVEHYWNPEHPHRNYIIALLSKLKFTSLLEVGCATGANLYRVKKAFPNTSIGGVELNEDAVKEASLRLPGAVIEQGSAENMFFSSKSVDVVLTDACLIYVGPTKINKVLKEIDRVARSAILFVELYSPSFLQRLLIRFAGYNAYNYPKLLKKLGYYDIELYKIPKEAWPGGPWEYWGYLIIAKK